MPKIETEALVIYGNPGSEKVPIPHLKSIRRTNFGATHLIFRESCLRIENLTPGTRSPIIFSANTFKISAIPKHDRQRK